jgi:hypothetical protein
MATLGDTRRLISLITLFQLLPVQAPQNLHWSGRSKCSSLKEGGTVEHLAPQGCAARSTGVPEQHGTPETVTITLQAKKGTDLTRALRALLKVALRSYGLRCVRIEGPTRVPATDAV